MLHRWSWQEESGDTFFCSGCERRSREIIQQGPPHTQGKAGREQRAGAEGKLGKLLSLCLALLICEQGRNHTRFRES